MADYYVWSAAAGAGTGADWTNAFTTLATAFTGRTTGNRFFVAHDHAETQASAMSMSIASGQVLCANRAGSVPPVSADLRTTGTVSTTGANSISIPNLNGAYWYGLTLSAGSGAVNSSINIGHAASGYSVFDGFQFNLNGSNTQTAVVISGPSFGASKCLWNNCKVSFAGTTANTCYIQVDGNFEWRNSPSAVTTSAGNSFLLRGSSTGTKFIALLEGVDVSALGSGKSIISPSNHGVVLVKDCKMDAAVADLNVSPAATSVGLSVTFSRSGASGNSAERHYTYGGGHVDTSVVVRTGGASDGTTLRSRKVTTATTPLWQMPFNCLPVAIWSDSTSAQTATVEGVWNGAALPTNDEIWLDLEYLGASGNPLGSVAHTGKADILATAANLTASTEAWDSGATARANITAYALGDVIKTASNTGRVFFCTTAGISNATEPAGYATAIDGGSVTDGTAVFRAGVRFKMAASFTPGQKGAIYAYVRVARASSVYYIDPLITLT